MTGRARPERPRRTCTFVQESEFTASPEELFAFHERPDAFQILQPPWETIEILQPPRSLEVGTRVEVKTRVGLLWQRIVAEHVAYEKGVSFEDVMLDGPFRYWHHRHLCLPRPGGGSLLRDEIEYVPPLGFLGRWLDPVIVRPRLRKMFRYRHEVTRQHLDG